MAKIRKHSEKIRSQFQMLNREKNGEILLPVQCMVFSVVCSFLNNFAKLVFSLVLYECKHMQTKSFVMDPKAITSRSS